MGSNIATTLASRWPASLNAVALLIASWVAVAWMSLQVRPGTDIIAVAFPPWWTSQQVFLATASADAAIVRTSALTSILVVRPNGFDGLKRLHDAGVWLAVDPQAIAACFKNIN
jgi:hypothetical protein